MQEENSRTNPNHQFDDFQLVAIVYGAFWAIIFGFYALRYDDDPEVCLASDESDFRIIQSDTTDSSTYEDVGMRFRLVFSVSFYAALI